MTEPRLEATREKGASARGAVNKAIKRAEAAFAVRRKAIESDETKTPDEKRDELLAAATELEGAIRSAGERSTA
jgi:hypothetical protein